jgi:hypothetical protein
MSQVLSGWDRSMAAAEAVKERMHRAAAALASGGIPYAIIGGNAVAEWVGSVDSAAVRNTRDVDILLQRSDFEAAKVCLEAAGFVHRHVKSIDMFLDGPGAKARDAVHILFAGEIVRTGELAVTPELSDIEVSPTGFQYIGLHALVTMKLTSYRLKDKVHLQDMISVELLDETWPAKFPSELGARLQAILDDPEG